MRSSQMARDSVRIARIETWLGLTAWRQGDYDEAERLGRRALELKLRLELQADLYKSFNALGLLAWNRGRLKEATDLFSRALAAATATGDEKGAAAVSGNLALVRTELGQFEEARAGFEAAREAGQGLGDVRVEGNALTNLGMLDIRVGDPVSAVRHLEAARVAYASIGYATGEQNALGQLGTAFAAMGDPGRAIAMLDSALVLARAQGLRQEEASNLEALAVIVREAGDVRRALELYAQAREINAHLGLDVERGVDQREAAEIHGSLGALEVAVALADSALQVHRETGARLDELRDLLLLTELAEMRGDRAAMEASLAAAGALADSMDAPQGWRELALVEAGLGDRQRDARRTLRALRRLGPDWGRAPFPLQEAAASLAARAHVGLGWLDSAVWYGRRAVYALERVRQAHRSGFLQTGYLADRGAVYGDLALALLSQTKVSEAFEVSDAARGRALLEHMVTLRSVGDTGDRPETALAASEEVLGRYSGITEQLALAETEVEPSDTSVTTLSALRAAADSLRLQYESAAHAAAEVQPMTAVLGTGSASSGAIQGVLQPGEVLLEYLATENELLIFGLTPTGVHHARVPLPAAALASRVRLVRGLLGRSESDVALAYPVLARLYQTLITPAVNAGWLDGSRRLLVATHGTLTYLPFAALREPRSGRFLAESHAVLHVPSGAALAALRHRAATPGASATRAPRGAAFAPLPEALVASRAEAEAVGRAAAARIVIGRGATEGAVRTALRGGGLVHIATHGYMNPGNPMRSRIALSPAGKASDDDGWLEVHEVLAERIASPLIFLSGCETGLGGAWSTSFSAGDDFVTLAQAFLHAGAENVVATLWPVQDRAAEELAKAYYAALPAADPVLALAEAQRALLRQPRFAHPYHWAGYRITGGGLNGGGARNSRPDVRLSVQSSLGTLVGDPPPSRRGIP